jgi:hypothetical protein
MDTGPIHSVTLDALDLVITSPSGDAASWSFVDSVSVSVSSSKQGSTLPTVTIATVSSPGAVRTMSFDVVPGVNLEPYIHEGSTVDSTGSGSAPDQNISYDGASVFTVQPL